MLQVRDVRDLERNLLDLGRLGPDEIERFLKEVADWYEFENPHSILDRQTFAQLCNAVRLNSGDIRRMACGALSVIQNQFQSSPEKSRFIGRFAANYVSRESNSARRWSGVLLSSRDYEDTLELFDVAKGDSVYSDEELVKQTNIFISRYRNSPDMFGRLSDDLTTLIEVVESPDTSCAERKIARAALVYFVETSDAIPDDLGPVGYLDDALVVSRAIKVISPERGVLASYLDELVTTWPFLLDLAFEVEKQRYPLSEYALINAAMLMSGVKDADDSCGVALVVPDFEYLPYLLGFLTALSRVFTFASADQANDFDIGDRLVDRETGEEYLFEGYRDSNFDECIKPEAVHFAVRQPKQRNKKQKLKNVNKSPGDLLVYKPIAHLAALQRSARETETLKTGSGEIDLEKIRLGPIENLFGATEPISLPPDLRTVVVVSKFRHAETAANSLGLFGVPCVEILPTGTARCDEEIDLRTWTKQGYGGKQLITVVRSTSDALEMAERFDRGIESVVGTVKPESTDAANFLRLASDGIPVLALVEERDFDSQTVFERGNFRFWTWDEEWLRYLHWPPQNSVRNHPIAEYEKGIRKLAAASVEVVELESAEIDKAYVGLRELEKLARDSEDESIKNTCAEGFLVFLSLLRTLSCDALDEQLFQKLDSYIQAGSRWWGDEILLEARAVRESLKEVASSLNRHNLKSAALDDWARENSGGVVVATARMKQQLSSNSTANVLRWMPSIKRSLGNEPVFLPSWLGRGTMERLLCPPVRSSVTLSLYSPEREWLEALNRSQKRNRARLRRLSRSRPALRSMLRRQPEETSTRSETLESNEPQIDQMLTEYRRSRALYHSAGDGDELVEARLVFFNGGHWAAFSPNARIHTFTHILDESAEDELPERPVSELQPGDRVLMVRGSDRDVVAHTADRHLPRGIRERAMLWQTALRRYVELGRSVREIQESLENQGCRRTTQTIRGWISDSHRIGPREPLEETLRSIALVTEDNELKSNIEACSAAIRRIRSAHISAGHELQEMLIKRVREWLDIEVPPDELVEVEEQVVLLAVEFVDAKPAQVSRSHLNRLKEDS